MAIVYVDNDIRLELIYSLPSLQIHHKSEVLMTPHPNGVDYIVLKSRLEEEETQNLDINSFMYLRDNYGWRHDYKNVERKKVIVEWSALSNRAKNAFDKLIDVNLLKEIEVTTNNSNSDIFKATMTGKELKYHFKMGLLHDDDVFDIKVVMGGK